MVHLLSSVPQIIEGYYFRLGTEGWLVLDPTPSKSCFVSLSKTLYPLLSAGSTQEPNMTEKILNQNYKLMVHLQKLTTLSSYHNLSGPILFDTIKNRGTVNSRKLEVLVSWGFIRIIGR